MFKLTNNLTLKEKLAVPRLIGHDSKTLITNVYSPLMGFNRTGKIDRNPNYMMASLELLASIEECIYSLTQNRNIMDSKASLFLDVLSRNFSQLFENLNINNQMESSRIIGRRGFIYPILNNLIKNSKYRGNTQDISLIIKPENQFPKDATYIPKGARKYKEFIEFCVHDKGIGFPESLNYLEKLTTYPEGESSFGLYITGLIAKALRAPVNISSKPGNTKVSFYHPIYPKE